MDFLETNPLSTSGLTPNAELRSPAMQKLTAHDIDEALAEIPSHELADLWRHNEKRLHEERQLRLRALMDNFQQLRKTG